MSGHSFLLFHAMRLFTIGNYRFFILTHFGNCSSQYKLRLFPYMLSGSLNQDLPFSIAAISLFHSFRVADGNRD